jgi:hypothetical protein
MIVEMDWLYCGIRIHAASGKVESLVNVARGGVLSTLTFLVTFIRCKKCLSIHCDHLPLEEFESFYIKESPLLKEDSFVVSVDDLHAM